MKQKESPPTEVEPIALDAEQITKHLIGTMITDADLIMSEDEDAPNTLILDLNQNKRVFLHYSNMAIMEYMNPPPSH